MARILVIEDEGVLRGAMVRGLAKLPGIEVADAGDLTEALISIDQQAPELILSDLDLPDRSGIELIGELAARGLSIPIVFISAYLEAYGARIPPHAGVRVLEKPVGLEELRALVLEQLSGTDSPDATSPFSAVDYLQLAGMGGHSVEISVTGPGAQGGSIFVQRGQVWHAEDADGEGREALTRLVNLKPARAACHTSKGSPARRTVEGRWEELVLEAARCADESARDAGGEAPDFDLDTAFAPDAGPSETPEPHDGFDLAMERGLEALLDKDYRAARSAFLDAQNIRPDDRVVEANIQRLLEMGFGPSPETEVESE